MLRRPDDFVNARDRNSDVASQTILADFYRLHELLEKDFTRMDWGKLLHGHVRLLSVTINNLDVESVPVLPTEAGVGAR